MQEVLNFVIVLVAAVGIASVISVLYASGLRLWAKGGINEKGEAQLTPRIASVVCFALCVFIVLFALWLMIPMFH